MKRLQTLLTGFGPFGTVVSNPTERLIAHFATEDIPGHELILRTLPVSFGRAAEILKAEIEIGGRNGRPFDIVLLLGVASGSKWWRIEQVGRNKNGAILDADGYTPTAGPILPDGAETYLSTLPTQQIIAAIAQLGLPVVASEHAGEYLCNHALYTTLRHLESIQHTARAGFIHVPADEQTFRPGVTTAPMFPFTQHVAAIRAALDVLANPEQRQLP